MASQNYGIKKPMPYVRLGNSGLKVSKLILGCMSYGSKEWQPWVLEEKEAVEHIAAAWELGINTFDTANVYSNGQSEIILGKAIKQLQLPREAIVVMTKLYSVVGKTPGERYMGKVEEAERLGYINQRGNSRKHIFDSVKASLKRLQLDYIDVLQLHRFDYDTPISETMQALHDVVQAGWVRYIGMSSCWAYQFQAMQNYAINNKLTPFISMQNHHSALYREEEREMIPTCEMFGVAVIPWSPLARGLITRPYSESQSQATIRAQSDRMGQGLLRSGADGSNKAIIDAVEAIAKKRNVTMAQVAIGWSLSKKGVTAPIIGTTNIESLKELVIGATEVELTEEEITGIENPYVPRDVFGHS